MQKMKTYIVRFEINCILNYHSEDAVPTIGKGMGIANGYILKVDETIIFSLCRARRARHCALI